jgi:hypothetical protein
MVVVVFTAIWLITVLVAVRDSGTFIQKIRKKIIAVNLAREGMEQMINIRNTNRQRYAWEKGVTRLKVNPGVNENTSSLTDDRWFLTGNYIILTNTYDGQQFFYASGINPASGNLQFDITKWTNYTGNLLYSLCESGGAWKACPGQKPKSKEGFFFRRIVGKGLYKKDVATPWGIFLNCPNGAGSCGDESAKEYRFCSIVEYDGPGKVELCSVLTNFKE